MIGLLAILILIFIILPILLGVLIYFLIKKYGNPKVAKYFAIVYGVILTVIAVNVIFEDQLFSKNDAKKLIGEQNIQLSEEFKILNNKSMSAIGDYYHTFTLEISEKDKSNGIKTIKNSTNFINDEKNVIDLLYDTNVNRYVGKKQTQNYETANYYVREYFQPNGKGYAPTFRRIKFDKNNNELIFEDIDE